MSRWWTCRPIASARGSRDRRDTSGCCRRSEKEWGRRPSHRYYSIVRLAFALVLIAVLASIACGNVIARKYEYEEEIFLGLDGSATVYVNASVPALVALRGVNLSVDSRARLDRQTVKDFYESPVTHVASVTTS